MFGESTQEVIEDSYKVTIKEYESFDEEHLDLSSRNLTSADYFEKERVLQLYGNENGRNFSITIYLNDSLPLTKRG